MLKPMRGLGRRSLRRSRNHAIHNVHGLWSEPHTRRRKRLLDGLLDLVKDDKACDCNYDCGCAGEHESFHGETPQEIGGQFI